MKIAILDDYQDCIRHLSCFGKLHAHDVKIFSHGARGIGQLAIRLAPFDVLVLTQARTAFNKQLLSKLPNLKLISQAGDATDHIDITAATSLGIAITNGASDPTAPAELTWALIMTARRKLVLYATNLKEGLWQTSSLSPAHNTLGFGLKGQILGIWGFGKIGRIVANYGRAFGMRVVIWGSQQSRTLALQDGFCSASTQENFFEQCDIISVHLRLTPETTGLITASDLAHMKPTALFVNTSHGALITAGALEEALNLGRPGSAALDVFENEPVSSLPQLLRMPNLLVTPHLGQVEQQSYETIFNMAFQNILDFDAGQAKNLCNPEVLSMKAASVGDDVSSHHRNVVNK